jgi:hypothetical protein
MTLQRRTPLKAKPRSKGNRGELAVINMLKDHGWAGARRNWQSGGQGGGDIVNGPADVHIEVKHCERCRITDWFKQAEAGARPTEIPVVVCRRNRMRWWAFMPADEFDAIFQIDPGVTLYTVVRTDRAKVVLWDWVETAEEGQLLTGTDSTAVRFSRPGGAEYAGAPAEDVFALIRRRETA